MNTVMASLGPRPTAGARSAIARHSPGRSHRAASNCPASSWACFCWSWPAVNGWSRPMTSAADPRRNGEVSGRSAGSTGSAAQTRDPAGGAGTRQDIFPPYSSRPSSAKASGHRTRAMLSSSKSSRSSSPRPLIGPTSPRGRTDGFSPGPGAGPCERGPPRWPSRGQLADHGERVTGPCPHRPHREEGSVRLPGRFRSAVRAHPQAQSPHHRPHDIHKGRVLRHALGPGPRA